MIQKRNALLLASLLTVAGAEAQDFNEFFENKTLRLDYIFAGDSARQAIYFEQAFSQPVWAGRKTRLAEKFLNEIGRAHV